MRRSLNSRLSRRRRTTTPYNCVVVPSISEDEQNFVDNIQAGQLRSRKNGIRERSGCLTCRIRHRSCPDPCSPSSFHQGPWLSCRACAKIGVECLGYSYKRPDWLKVPGVLKEVTEAIKDHSQIRKGFKEPLSLGRFHAFKSEFDKHNDQLRLPPQNSDPGPSSPQSESADLESSDSVLDYERALTFVQNNDPPVEQVDAPYVSWEESFPGTYERAAEPLLAMPLRLSISGLGPPPSSRDSLSPINALYSLPHFSSSSTPSPRSITSQDIATPTGTKPGPDFGAQQIKGLIFSFDDSSACGLCTCLQGDLEWFPQYDIASHLRDFSVLQSIA